MQLCETASSMPSILTGENLFRALTVLPEYDEDIRWADASQRLLALSDFYDIYFPSVMSMEIYTKMYTSLLRSLQKKGTRLATLQQLENHRTTIGLESRGIIGGADSFTIIGPSGIGKSSAIERTISLLNGRRVIVTEHPFCKVIPVLSVQCPFDCSVKNMLHEILRAVDEAIGTAYYPMAVHAKATTDMLIGAVSQAALNHIGLLIVDEIQNVVAHRNGNMLIATLTQLINSSGISICLVGTPECILFFEKAIHLARRTTGLRFDPLPFDDYFHSVCHLLLTYSFVRKPIESTEALIRWLYEHTGGLVGVLISLIHDAQEIAILHQTEALDMAALQAAYQSRMSSIHIHTTRSQPRGTSSVGGHSRLNRTSHSSPAAECRSLAGLIQETKNCHLSIVQLLQNQDLIKEIDI